MQVTEYSADVFARNLRMQRAGMDISQRELAEKAGVESRRSTSTRTGP